MSISLEDIIAVNELFNPLYPYVSRQILENFQGEEGRVLEIGPYGPGISIEIAKALPKVNIFVGDDFPGLLEYFHQKVQEVKDRARVILFDKYEFPFKDESFDLAIFRGTFFFWEEEHRILKEMERVLRPGGLMMAGGGFGKSTPDSLIESILPESHRLNRKLGKKVLSSEEVERILELAGLKEKAILEKEHGLWVKVRK